MRKAVQTRLDRLVEAWQVQDAAVVKETISTFLGGLTPDQVYECREPATLRPRLEAFLAAQSPRTLATIERWSAAKKGGQ